jgi:hypothetical protein
MLTSIQILDLLKEKFGSDYRTAKEMEIAQPKLSKIRNSNAIMNDEQGLKAAQILGLEPEFIISSLVAERSKASPAYSILQKIADKFEPKAAAAAVFFSVFLVASLTLPQLPVLA